MVRLSVLRALLVQQGSCLCVVSQTARVSNIAKRQILHLSKNQKSMCND